jgi:proline dehydrogenase
MMQYIDSGQCPTHDLYVQGTVKCQAGCGLVIHALLARVRSSAKHTMIRAVFGHIQQLQRSQ